MKKLGRFCLFQEKLFFDKPLLISNKPEIERLLLERGLKEWKYNPGKRSISRNLQFVDFYNAFSFMKSVALAAERYNHHPEWFNVYNRVDIDLRTHDCDGVSLKDIQLAQVVDYFEKQFQSKKVSEFTHLEIDTKVFK